MKKATIFLFCIVHFISLCTVREAFSRGEPREMYDRTYWVIYVDNNQSITELQVRKLAGLAYDDNKRTLGYSFDDAGIGDLNVRNIVVWGLPQEKVTDYRNWYQDYYGGVTVEFRSFPWDSNNKQGPFTTTAPASGRGNPRIDYSREYWVMDGNTSGGNAVSRQKFIDIAAEAFNSGKQTIGCSFDDAGIGDLSNRKVVVKWKGQYKESELRTFYSNYYSGVDLYFGDTTEPPIDPPSGSNTKFGINSAIRYTDDNNGSPVNYEQKAGDLGMGYYLQIAYGPGDLNEVVKDIKRAFDANITPILRIGVAGGCDFGMYSDYIQFLKDVYHQVEGYNKPLYAIAGPNEPLTERWIPGLENIEYKNGFSPEDLDLIASKNAEYMNAIIDGTNGLNNLRLLSPVFNCTDGNNTDFIKRMKNHGARFDELDGIAGNTYNVHTAGGLTISHFLISCQNALNGITDNKDHFFITEMGAYESEINPLSKHKISHSTALQNLHDQVSILRNNSTVKAALFFNGFDTSSDPNFDYGIIHDDQWGMILGESSQGQVMKNNMIVNHSYETDNLIGWHEFGSAPEVREDSKWFYGISAKDGQTYIGRARNGSGAGKVSGGLYQKVSTTPGNKTRAMVYLYTRRDDGGHKVKGNELDAKGRVGIDPIGGSDPNSGNIIWSSWQEKIARWEWIATPEVTCTNQKATVFLQYSLAGGSSADWLLVAFDGITMQDQDNTILKFTDLNMKYYTDNIADFSWETNQPVESTIYITTSDVGEAEIVLQEDLTDNSGSRSAGSDTHHTASVKLDKNKKYYYWAGADNTVSRVKQYMTSETNTFERSTAITSIFDDDIQNDTDFMVYPNPFNDFIDIQTGVLKSPDRVKITLYNVHGKKIDGLQPIRFENGNIRLHFDGITVLSKGIYILQISNKDYNRSVKIVKSEQKVESGL